MESIKEKKLFTNLIEGGKEDIIQGATIVIDEGTPAIGAYSGKERPNSTLTPT